MPGAKPSAINLNDVERQGLELLVRRYTTGQQKVILSIEERLDDLPRPGVPPRLTANQICQIQQLACEKPGESGRPISQWTGREIADEMGKTAFLGKSANRNPHIA